MSMNQTREEKNHETSIYVLKEDTAILDDAKDQLFVTDGVSYRRVIRRLAADHPAVDFPHH